jgi:hypothetical protein
MWAAAAEVVEVLEEEVVVVVAAAVAEDRCRKSHRCLRGSHRRSVADRSRTRPVERSHQSSHLHHRYWHRYLWAESVDGPIHWGRNPRHRPIHRKSRQ